MEKIRTHCKAIDTLTDGGLPTGTITQIFGEKALGKSIISFQTACSAVAEGNSAIVLDTEQSYLSYLIGEGQWAERLGKRFGKSISVEEARLTRTPKSLKKGKPAVSRSELITALSSTLTKLDVRYMETHLGAIADILSPEFVVDFDANGPSVLVLQMPEVVDLLNLHGIDAGKEVSEGGRVELRLRQTPLYQSTLHQLIQETKAKLLVYDSISAPLKASFPSTQDLPARSAGLAMLLSHAQRLSIEFGIAVLVISHTSINPIHAWERRPYGGVILGHEAKFSFELTKGEAKRNKEAQAVNPEDDDGHDHLVWVQRHPALGDYSRFGFAKIDEEGVH